MAKKAKKDAEQTETVQDVPETVAATEEKTPQEMSDLKQKHYDAICSLNQKG